MAIPQHRSEPGEITTLLGKGSHFEGKLTFEGTVRIDGKLTGQIFSEDVLVIGEGAEVNAELDVGEVIVQGSVVGNIKARRSIELRAPARVKGDLHTASLLIDRGVVFEGYCKMDSAMAVTQPMKKEPPPPPMARAQSEPPIPLTTKK